jgi:hypothetical protein
MMILLQTDGVGELCSVLKPLLSPLIAAVGRMAADWRTIHRSKWFELMQSLADLLFYRFADMETADLWVRNL